MLFNKKIATAVIAVATLFSISGFAAVPLSLDSLNPTLIQQQPVKFNGNNESVYTGGIGGNLAAGPNSIFFCVDLRHNINVPGNYSVNLVNPNVATPAFMQLGSPFNMQVAASLLNNTNIAGFGADTDKYIGMQLALWSIVYNWTSSNHPTNTLGTASDLFSAPNIVDPTILANAFADLSLAESFILNNTYSSSYGNYRLLLDVNNAPGNVKQALIGVTTPEPQTYLVLAAFLVVGMLSAKRRANAQA